MRDRLVVGDCEVVFGVHCDLAGVARPVCGDGLGVLIGEAGRRDESAGGVAGDGRVDNSFTAGEISEGVRADAEFADAPGAALSGVVGPVAGGGVGVLPQGAGAH